MKKILVTGGTGFIGSHTVVQLLQKNYQVVILDNLSNSHRAVLANIETITGKQAQFYEGDIQDSNILEELFNTHQFDAVIHFAGLKAVGESVKKPLHYYNNNVQGTLVLLEAMQKAQCFRLVFSSSATVYGDPKSVPITEGFPLSATNPYGQSKLMIEHILRDTSHADAQWQISILRYFNPVAAHPSGLIGEDPQGTPNNLLPYIAQVAIGKLKNLSVFGDDYDTVDGTGVRDYIHVLDLADAHLAALSALKPNYQCQAHNVGTGTGYSVLEMIRAFEKASGRDVPFTICPRRAGDIASCYADPSLSRKQLQWQARFTLDDMMQDQWRWQSNNPNGYLS